MIKKLECNDHLIQKGLLVEFKVVYIEDNIILQAKMDYFISEVGGKYNFFVKKETKSIDQDKKTWYSNKCRKSHLVRAYYSYALRISVLY